MVTIPIKTDETSVSKIIEMKILTRSEVRFKLKGFLAINDPSFVRGCVYKIYTLTSITSKIR
mgnify:CR=1 FL=1